MDSNRSTTLIHPIIVDLFISQQELAQFDNLTEIFGPPEKWDEELTNQMLDVAENYGKIHERAIKILGVAEVNLQLNLFESLGDYKNVN